MASNILRRRRVVVTGMGAITPLGNTLVDSWHNLLKKESGITSLEEALKWQDLPGENHERELEIAKSLPCSVAAPVRWCNYDTRTPRFVQLTNIAGSEAMRNASLLSWLGLPEDDDNDSNPDNSGKGHGSDEDTYQRRKERVGVCVGSAMSSVREIVEGARIMQQSGARRLSPHFVPKALSNSASGRLSLKYQLRGPNHTASTACAAGSHAIGDAMRCILYGNADVMLAGGAEAAIDPFSMNGFCRLRALSTNKDPAKASRPFDKSRDGFVMGEGSAILVLEELEHAQKRGVPILAELCGYGLTGDAYHITSPEPSGYGAERAMRMAIDEARTAAAAAGVDDNILEDIGYVNAHATSTPKGDEIEALAIDRIFSSISKNKDSLFVSSTKGATGHLLGAAGAIEAAFSVLSIKDQTIPPTCNLEDVDDDDVRSFQHVTDTLKDDITLKAAISNSFGFGGTNASLVFKQFTE